MGILVQLGPELEHRVRVVARALAPDPLKDNGAITWCFKEAMGPWVSAMESLIKDKARSSELKSIQGRLGAYQNEVFTTKQIKARRAKGAISSSSKKSKKE